jgi:hypothetical protein
MGSRALLVSFEMLFSTTTTTTTKNVDTEKQSGVQTWTLHDEMIETEKKKKKKKNSNNQNEMKKQE